MRRLTMLSLAATLWGLGLAPGQDTAKKERRELEGTWNVVAAEMFGKPLSAEGCRLEKIVIKRYQISFAEAGKEGRAVPFSMNSGDRPGTIDLTTIREGQLRTWKGIYSVDGDELRLCLPMVPRGRGDADPPRPENFEARDRPHLLIRAKREKP